LKTKPVPSSAQNLRIPVLVHLTRTSSIVTRGKKCHGKYFENHKTSEKTQKKSKRRGLFKRQVDRRNSNTCPIYCLSTSSLGVVLFLTPSTNKSQHFQQAQLAQTSN
ncbi:unnamed protein product, partial [Ectocarpus sp. 13 AM-2016]